MKANTNTPSNSQQSFKDAVESYWRNPGSITNRPSFDRRISPGEGDVTNGPQPGKTQWIRPVISRKGFADMNCHNYRK
jgi:hypothetical protein